MLEGIPTFAKIDIPREIIEDYDGNLFKMEFPLNMVINSNQNTTLPITVKRGVFIPFSLWKDLDKF